MAIVSLANAELSLMELLWLNASMTARQLREELYPDSSKAQHGTVQRLLQRLEEKGFVARERSLAVNLFRAAVSREDYAAGRLEALADKVMGGSLTPLITLLLEKKNISRFEIDRLRKILEAEA